ncbi:hypothetical protein GAYE_PCTG32G0823 [Galdieria yellowstonensis]|uniref:FHA domain-containing protein n=1 Tax=Galdieria yellowstonensis TaxID=3028027 RepID=A0AAV9I363_9RHOD|nr:hypothetical protein GAYE_PCTG32G0823 [Galdieria yellowstonensis]
MPDGAYAFAKLEGKVFLSNGVDVNFEYYIPKDSVMFGRSSGNPDKPLEPGDKEVDCGVGDSNKLSRKHAQFKYNRNTGKYEVKCLGKNGITVATDEKTVFLTQDSPPFPLKSKSLLQMGDCLFIFLLPIGADNPTVSFARSRPKRDWSKADLQALRTGLVKLGFGRWKEINELTGGRLLDHSEEEITQVARGIVAKCYISARAQSERKAMLEIINDSLEGTEEEKEQKVNALIKEAEKDLQPSEKGKYLRWARKLRLLQRVQQVVHDPSLQKLKEGKLFINTVPPAPWWRPEDDMNLVLGIYKHGYGNAEDIRKDPELGFYDRTSPSIASSSASVKQSKESSRTGDGDEDEEDFEEDEEEEENEEQETSVNPMERKAEGQTVEEMNAFKRQDSEASSLPPFPPADAIMRRLKSVLVACMKDMVRLMKEDSKATGRKAVKKEGGGAVGDADEVGDGKNTHLNKKEMTEFEKIIVSYGLFYQNEGQRDWKQFAILSKVLENKTEDALEAAFLKLMWECYCVLEGPILGQTYMEIFRLELTEGQLASLESDYRQSRTVAYFNLNIERSRTILESISLFRFLRLRVLTDPNLSETVKNCRKMKELPFWWRSVHDRALLYGVDKHGLNNWEAVAEDPELGFPATLEKLAQKKQNESGSVNEKDFKFPKAKVCQKRFNLLLDLFVSSLESFEDYNAVQQSSSSLVIDALQFNRDILKEQPLVMVGDPRGVVEIPKNSETGELRLPFDVGCGLVILSLGHIDRRPHYYNSREIFPVGFKSVRLMQGQGRESTAVRGRFLCEVLDGGDAGPLFSVSALSNLSSIDEWTVDSVLSKKTYTIIERNPTIAWLKICNESEIALTSSKGVSGKIVAVSGKERFGFYDTTVLYYIEQLDGCEGLEGYSRRQFPLVNIRPVVVPCSPGEIAESMRAICKHVEQQDEPFSLPEDWFSEAESRKRLRTV